MATRAEQMSQILRTLVSNTPDVEAAAVVSVDGLVVSSVLPVGVDEDRVAAMAAALLSLGDRTSQELGRDALEQVYVKGKNGYVILIQTSPETVLEAIAGPSAKLGMVLLDMKRAAQEISRIL